MSNTEALQAWAAEILPVVQAIVDGYQVEFRLTDPELNADVGWLQKTEPGFSGNAEYRIKPILRTGWINLNAHQTSPTGASIGGLYETKEKADEMACGDRVACIEITWEERR